MRPKRNVPDHDSRYTVSSYGLRPRTAEHASVARTDKATEPKTWADALARPELWEAACQEERQLFGAMGVYEVVPRPEGRKVIGSKWVYRIKRAPDGVVQKCNAHVVARDFTLTSPKLGVDYD